MYTVQRLPPASLLQRWVANLIDLIVIGGLVGYGLWLHGQDVSEQVTVRFVRWSGITGHNQEISKLLLGVACLLVFELIRVLIMCRPGRRRGQSLGHQLVGSKIVRYDDQPITKYQAFANGIITPLLLGVFSMIPFGGAVEDYGEYKSYRKDRTSLEDNLSGTRTISVRA